MPPSVFKEFLYTSIKYKDPNFNKMNVLNNPEEHNTIIDDTDPVNFDKLVNDILENPERLLDPNISADQILEIQKRLNPYAGIAGPPPSKTKKKIAAVSYTNLKEDYLRRFTATSLVGFLFQMYNEWEVPVEQRQWTPNSNTQAKTNPVPFEPEDLVQHLKALVSIAEEAQTSANNAATLKRETLESDVILPADATEEQKSEIAQKYMEVAALEAKTAGLLYVVTHMTHRLGLEATSRLKITAETGSVHPEVKEILKQHPLPLPPTQLEFPAANSKEIINSFLQNLFKFDPNTHVRAGHSPEVVAAAAAEAVASAAVASVEAAVADTNAYLSDKLKTAAAATAAATTTTYEQMLLMPVNVLPEDSEMINLIYEDYHNYNTIALLLRNEDLRDILPIIFSSSDTMERFRRYMLPVKNTKTAVENVPPQDTFHRWSYYTEVNYEELKNITNIIYPERSDLDWTIALWDVFEGTQKETQDAFNNHCQRYQSEVTSSIKAIEFGAWTFLADYKENRKNIQFYNKNTEVLKRIIDRHAEDKKIGTELMKNRVRQAKARNIKTDGPDDIGLATYKRSLVESGQDLSQQGVEKVISTEEMRRLEKAKGDIKAARELELLDQYTEKIKELENISQYRPLSDEEERNIKFYRENIDKVKEMIEVPYDTIQVDVFTNDTTTGTFSKSHFYTKADSPEEVNAKKKLADDIAKNNLAPYARDFITSNMK